jgi:HD-GYP domain-containing protein (c-di-GMP phosphodiesterase class II)
MRSIRGKLLITLLLTAVISTVLVGIFILKDSERMTYTMVKDSNLAELRNVRDYYFEKLITDMEKLVAYWSKEEALADYTLAPGQPHITRMIPNNFMLTYKKWISISEASDDITWLYFGLEADGSIFIAPTDPSMPLDYDCREREWYKQAITDPYVIHWSDPYVDAGQSGKMLQTVSKAVVKDGVIIGVFAIDIEVNRFNEILGKLTYGKNAQLFIVNAQGKSLAGTRHESVDVMTYYDLHDLNKEETLIRKVEGVEVIVSIMPLSTNKWILISAQQLNIQSAMKASGMRIFWAALVQIIVTIILGFAVSGHLFKPLETLLGVIKGVSKGDIKMRSKVASKDEFGILSRDFDTMLDNIEELIYERDHHLKSLKKKNKEIMNGKEEIVAYSSQVEAMNDELSRLLNELGDNYLSTVKALANAIEASDDYTRGHCERVGDISKRLAEHMGMSYDNLNDLVYACVLHDIGKIAISDKILNKRAPLTKDELSMIKMHPLIGYEIIKDVHFLEKPSQILLQHHERVDGLGYPYGLSKEDILLEAKILSVADAYDAMTSARAYRQLPLTKAEVLEELNKGRGAQFDENVVDALIALLKESEDHL